MVDIQKDNYQKQNISHPRGSTNFNVKLGLRVAFVPNMLFSV